MGVLLKPLNPDALEQAARGLMSLTQSEYRVLRALFAGITSTEIAVETGYTKLTVQFYLKTIFRKCHCDRLALARMAARLEQDAGVARHLAALAMMTGSPLEPRRHGAPLDDRAAPREAAGAVSGDRRRTRSRSVERRPFKPRRKLA